jgi:hypothetical protein
MYQYLTWDFGFSQQTAMNPTSYTSTLPSNTLRAFVAIVW